MHADVLKAIRRFCRECQGGREPAVLACADTACLLFSLRCRKVEPPEAPYGRGPARAVRRFCLSCAGSRAEVRACDARQTCALWSYRFGVSPETFRRVVARQRQRRMELLLPGFARR